MKKQCNKKGEQQQKTSSVATRETLGVVLILFTALSLVCLISGGGIFSLPGAYVQSFLLGAFGYFAYVLCLFVMMLGVLLVAGKKTGLNKKRKFLITSIFILFALLAQAITMHSSADLTYGEYLSLSYSRGAGGLATCTGGGVVTGVVAFCISRLLTPVGCYIVLGVLIALTAYILTMDFVKNPKTKVEKEEHRSSFVKVDEQNLITDYSLSGTKDYPVSSVELNGGAMGGMQKLFISNPENFAVKSKKELKNPTGDNIKIGSVGSGMNIGVMPAQPVKAQSAPNKFTPAPKTVASQEFQEKLDYIKTPPQIKLSGYEDFTPPSTTVSQPISRTESKADGVIDIPYFEHDESGVVDEATSHAENFNSKYADIEEFDNSEQEIVRPRSERLSVEADSIDKAFGFEEEFKVEEKVEEVSAKDILNLLKSEDSLINEDVKEEPVVKTPPIRERRTRLTPPTVAEPIQPTPEPAPVEQAAESEQKEQTPVEDNFIFPEYVRPPLNLLANYDPPADAPKEDHETKMAVIEETLHQFKLDAKVAGYVQGPTLTRYELTMPIGKSVKEVSKYDDDLKMRLKVEGGIRIEAPIPGLDRVGVEVANRITQKVGLKKTLEGMAAKPLKAGELRFAVGQDLLGNAIFDNLAAGPHYLVAGSTGSGKSVCLHIMIISLIMTYGPSDLRLILVNPKVVEFGIYKGLPHLLIDEVLNNSNKTAAALSWAYDEMIRRGNLFLEHADTVVNIDDYNKYIANDKIPKLPRIVIVIDEYADLVSDGNEKELNAKVAALAQMSRSAGIHLVLATQRPTTNIVTGTIKTNLPSRIALKLTNATDSMTIIDEAGAEKLIGYGDMLYRNAGMANCKRYQGAFIDRMEMKGVLDFIKQNNPTHFDQKLIDMVRLSGQEKEEPTSASTSSGGGEETERNMENDPMFLKCLAFGVRNGSLSISALLRHFPIGYNKAARIFDKIESLGYVSENEGSKARTVLLTKEGFENTYGPLSNYGV